MKKETIEKGKGLLEDLDDAEELLEEKPWNITIVGVNAFGKTYYRFRTETAQREITEFARKVYESLKKELEDLKEEEVHAHWEYNGIEGSILSKCSECGFDLGAHIFNYCPICGAKMDEIELEEGKEDVF